MPLTTIRSSPAADSFTLLADHQSQTPSSFYGAKPVLYQHIVGARALVSRDQASKLPIFPTQEASAHAESLDPAGETAREALPPTTAILNVFVSSENLTLYNPSISAGVSIPYPSISLHAIQRLPDPNDSAQEAQGLYVQLELDVESSEYDDDEPETMELTLLPPSLPQAQSDDPSTTQLPSDSVKALFEAVSACSNLNPDPVDQQDDEDMLDSDDRIVFEGNVGYEGISGLPGVSRGASDGGLPPPFPGSGGWITAENVNEFFDAEGNWIGGTGDEGEDWIEPLGEGAGRVRGRDEVDAAEEGHESGPKVNGHGEGEEDEHKRPKIE